MVSRTKVTETRRANKTKNSGAKRKAQNRNKGTTPKFEIHTEAAVANEKKAAKKA